VVRIVASKVAKSLMRKGRGPGVIKVWCSRKKGGKIKRECWSNGQILVLDDFGAFSPSGQFSSLPLGSYRYDSDSGVLIQVNSGKIPKLLEAIPKLTGYRKAKPVMDDFMLRLNRLDEKTLLVTLEANGVRVRLNYDYYQYLVYRFADSSWKVKAPDEQVVFYYGKTLAAVVMPVKV